MQITGQQGIFGAEGGNLEPWHFWNSRKNMWGLQSAQFNLREKYESATQTFRVGFVKLGFSHGVLELR